MTATTMIPTINSPYVTGYSLSGDSISKATFVHIDRCIDDKQLQKKMHSLCYTILDRHTAAHTLTTCDREQHQRHVNNTRRAFDEIIIIIKKTQRTENKK